MASDFSRTLALLRREKRISQRTAATDLQVSQALLSHYENGLREPGLSFVLRAAEYYGVTCDYLLGRSMVRRESGTGTAEQEPVHAPQTDASTLVESALGQLLALAERAGSKQLNGELATYFSLAVYRAFRYLYMADPQNSEAAFHTKNEHFDALCDARAKLTELRLRAAAKGAGGFGLTTEEVKLPALSLGELDACPPEETEALLMVLQKASDEIAAFAGED
jgi:transcriptional regulator with XRE-family HTH domain